MHVAEVNEPAHALRLIVIDMQLVSTDACVDCRLRVKYRHSQIQQAAYRLCYERDSNLLAISSSYYFAYLT